MKSIQRSIVALAAALCTFGAQAESLYSAGSTGVLETPASVDAGFSAGAGAGMVNPQLQGANSLGGDNYNIDIFHVGVNGSAAFSAAFGLGVAGWGLNSIEITGNTVAAVPEPETYAMLLAGLGVIGVMARRRAAAR